MRLIAPFACWLVIVMAVPADDGPAVIAQPDSVRTLVNPQCSHCRDEAKRRSADLKPDDRVLAWTRGYSDGGAIPLRFFLNAYRVISDSYGVFVHDPDAGYLRGFAPSYEFRFHGWRNGIMVMKHKDGTLYSCLSGAAIAGPKDGTRLTSIPTMVSDWGFMLEHYPQAVAYHMFDKYQPLDLPTSANADSLASRGKPDARLKAETQVLGVWTGKTASAYPIDTLAQAGISDGRDRSRTAGRSLGTADADGGGISADRFAAPQVQGALARRHGRLAAGCRRADSRWRPGRAAARTHGDPRRGRPYPRCRNAIDLGHRRAGCRWRTQRLDAGMAR